MYPKVEIPKKVTERWLKSTFAPLVDHLVRCYPDTKDSIIPFMEFMGNTNQRFYYRNAFTKGSIIFDQAGQLVSCDKDALEYKFNFGRSNSEPANRPPMDQYFVHPNVTRWMRERLNRRHMEKYSEVVRIFMQEFWGPMINYDFGDLVVGYPLQGMSVRHCLYMYPSEYRSMIMIQFVGDEIVEERCSFAELQNFRQRERELIYRGWHVVTIIREVLDEDPDQFRQYLAKAVELALPRENLEYYVLTEAGRKEAEKLFRENEEKR